MIRYLSSLVGGLAKSGQRGAGANRPRAARLQLEALEDRQLLSANLVGPALPHSAPANRAPVTTAKVSSPTPASVSSVQAAAVTTTLAVTMSTSNVVVQSTSASGFPDPIKGFFIQIDNEIMKVTSGSNGPPSIWVVVRAINGVRQQHNAGARITLVDNNQDNPRPPGPPTSLQGQATSQTTVHLTWNAATDATGYRVQMYTTNQGWIQVGGDIVGRTWADVTGLTPGVTYYFRVRAYNAAGDSYSGYISVTMPTPGHPPAPEPLRVTAIGQTSATLAWSVAPSALGYRLYIWNGSTWVKLYENRNQNQITVTVTGLQPGTTYYFMVGAYNNYPGEGDTRWIAVTTRR